LAIDLDKIYWGPGGYKLARDRSLSAKMVREASEADRWVIEGFYGRLAREALPYAALVNGPASIAFVTTQIHLQAISALFQDSSAQRSCFIQDWR
jgi:hypothetical protein